jgi:hypothetical protein
VLVSASETCGGVVTWVWVVGWCGDGIMVRALTLVYGRSSSVMRSKRELV